MDRQRGRITTEDQVERAMTENLAGQMIGAVARDHQVVGQTISRIKVSEVGPGLYSFLSLELGDGTTINIMGNFSIDTPSSNFGEALRAENARQAAQEAAQRGPDPIIAHGEALMRGTDEQHAKEIEAEASGITAEDAEVSG